VVILRAAFRARIDPEGEGLAAAGWSLSCARRCSNSRTPRALGGARAAALAGPAVPAAYCSLGGREAASFRAFAPSAATGTDWVADGAAVLQTCSRVFPCSTAHFWIITLMSYGDLCVHVLTYLCPRFLQPSHPSTFAPFECIHTYISHPHKHTNTPPHPHTPSPSLSTTRPREGGSTHTIRHTLPHSHTVASTTIAPHIPAAHPPRYPRMDTSHSHPHAPTGSTTHPRMVLGELAHTGTPHPTRTQQPEYHRTTHTGSSACGTLPHRISAHERDLSSRPHHLPQHPRIRDESAHSLVLTMPHSRTEAITLSRLTHWQPTPRGTLLCILHTQSIVDVQVETLPRRPRE